MLSSRELATRLAEVGQDGSASGQVVIDLTGVSFLDSSGIAALMAFALACADRGVTLRTVPTPTIRRSFVITGLTEAMGLEDAANDAVPSGEDISGADA